MRRVWMTTLLAATLALAPATGAAQSGGHCYYQIDSTLRLSDVMILQERRLASDDALLQMEAEAIQDQLDFLEAAISLCRGSINDEALATWQELMTSRRQLLDEEVAAGAAHLVSVRERSHEAFLAAVEPAAHEIEARGLCHTKLCETSTKCEGKNMSRRVALTIDGDPDLEEALNTLARLPWPQITTYRTRPVPSEPVGAGRDKGEPQANFPHVDVLELARSVEEVARTLELADSTTRSGADARIAARQRVGEALWTALDRVRKKARRDGWGDVQVCLNPPRWGGCGRGDVTERAADALAADKKLPDQMEALRTDLGE